MPSLRTRRIRAVIVTAVLAGTLAACAACAAGTPTDTRRVALIELSPAQITTFAGSTVPLTIQLQDISGNAVRSAPVFWSSSDTAVASVSSNGVVVTRIPGVVSVAASASGVSAVSQITVIEVVVVTVAPASATISAAGAVQLAARDKRGDVISGRPVMWASSDSRHALVSTSGLVLGIRKGSVNITATADGVSGTSRITVR